MEFEQRLVKPNAADLTTIRNGVLLFLQDPASTGDLKMPIEKLAALSDHASASEMPEIAAMALECIARLKDISQTDRRESERSLRFVLDRLVQIEACLYEVPMDEDLSFANISAFVDESFEHLTGTSQSNGSPHESDADVGFEIDDEILEIFRTESSEILNAISSNLKILAEQPAEKEALWEMRRSMHTFKGAAGVIGLKDASNLSHRIEDLLGQLVENDLEANASVIDLLNTSVEYLTCLSEGVEPESGMDTILQRFANLIEKNEGHFSGQDVPDGNSSEIKARPVMGDVTKPVATPIVRVSLDRLYELQTIALQLAIARTSLAENLDRFTRHSAGVQPNSESLVKVEELLARQLTLSNELQEKLEQIRMVRFGTLSTRLNRAVHVTCQEENKAAELIIKNEDIELDTQIIDALVEPLLHLLRNAVVHGIEPPEMRRMIGKPEKARIAVGVERSESEIVLSVADDGRGITVSRLKERALISGAISQQLAESMTDEEAMELMFLRGVTTAEKLNLNAGRGIGMSIVREGVESRGGSISIRSEAQKGTVFEIRLPLFLADAKVETPETETTEPIPTPEPGDQAPKDEQPEIPEFIPMTAPDGLTVLIVDDSALMRQTITKVVEKAGWEAITANDGKEALIMLKTGKVCPNIIVTDLEMPVLDGLGFIEAVKRDLRFSQIPMIMITSRSERVHREKAFALGAAKFLTKPVEGGELKSIINSLCLVPA